jgi:hypothetical protein
LQLAERRLAEAEQLAVEGNVKAEDAIERYQDRLERAKTLAEGVNTGDIIEKVTERTNLHISTLERVLEKAPEQAQQAISTVIENAKQRQEVLLERLEQIDPEKAAAVGVHALSQRVQDVKERITEKRDDRAESVIDDIEKWRSFIERIRAEHEGVDDEIADELDDAVRRFDELENVWGDAPEALKDRLGNIKERVIDTHTETIRNIADQDPDRAVELMKRAAQNRLEAATQNVGDAAIIQQRMQEAARYEQLAPGVSAKIQQRTGTSTNIIEEMLLQRERTMQRLQTPPVIDSTLPIEPLFDRNIRSPELPKSNTDEISQPSIYDSYDTGGVSPLERFRQKMESGSRTR